MSNLQEFFLSEYIDVNSKEEKSMRNEEETGINLLPLYYFVFKNKQLQKLIYQISLL